MLRLKEIREYQGISQKGLADLLNVSPSNIYNYETGRTEPSTDILCKLANCLNVSIDYLVGNEETEQTTRFEAKTVLDEKEKELIRVYRSLSDGGKNTLIGSAHNIERFDPQVSAAKKA